MEFNKTVDNIENENLDTSILDFIEIKIYCKRVGLLYIAKSSEEYEKLTKEEKKEFQVLKLKMRRLTWGMYNTLETKATRYDKDYAYFNDKIYKEEKLKMLLVEWNAERNSNGVLEKVPLCEEEILNLSPEIAEKILLVYDSLTFVSKEEEKKLANSIRSYIKSSGRNSYFVSRDLIENDLIDEFHWLPQEIEKIPYRKLQMMFIVRREKHAARQTKIALDEESRKLNSTSGRGQTRRR